MDLDKIINHEDLELPNSSKKRIKYSYEQVSILEREFEKDKTPSKEKREELARLLGRDKRSIQIWFQNRRAKTKSYEPIQMSPISHFFPYNHLPQRNIEYDETTIQTMDNTFKGMKFIIGTWYFEKEFHIFIDTKKLTFNIEFHSYHWEKLEYSLFDIAGIRQENKSENICHFKMEVYRPPKFCIQVNEDQKQRGWMTSHDFTSSQAFKYRYFDIFLSMDQFKLIIKKLEKIHPRFKEIIERNCVSGLHPFFNVV